MLPSNKKKRGKRGGREGRKKNKVNRKQILPRWEAAEQPRGKLLSFLPFPF